MPYDFILTRITKDDNESALASNKKVAKVLIDSFTEIHDSNAQDSSHFYSNTTIDYNKEYPDLHFHLEADTETLNIIFNFWRQYIIIELSAGHNPDTLFEQVKKYAEKIIQCGFMIEDASNERLLNIDEGIKINIEEYISWCGLVDQVKNNLRKNG